MPLPCLTDWASIWEFQPHHRSQFLLNPVSLCRGCRPHLSQALEITTRGPCHCLHYAECCFGICGPASKRHMLTPCCLVLLSGCIRRQECTALPSSSGVTLLLLPSWTGPQGGDVPSPGLACAWERTPEGIHGHCTSYPTSNTSTLQHRQKRAARPHLDVPSPSGGQGQDRWARALNEFGWSWQSSSSGLSWT